MLEFVRYTNYVIIIIIIIIIIIVVGQLLIAPTVEICIQRL